MAIVIQKIGGGSRVILLFGASFCVLPNSLLGNENKKLRLLFCIPLTLHYLCNMISKNRLKSLRQLESKKHRYEMGLFVGEGPKVVGELLRYADADTVVCTSTWASTHPNVSALEFYIVTDDELRRLSFLQHPQQVFATFRLPCHDESVEESAARISNQLCLALDGVQDPGNVGTIIRIADWFGIDTIYCSTDTADAYNPKVVQATMGSIARVSVIPTDLASLIDHLPSSTPVYGTVLDGDNVYDSVLGQRGLLVMGNEGNGLSTAIRSRLTHRLLIPPYPADNATAESLNVAIATAICCAEFRRCAPMRCGTQQP